MDGAARSSPAGRDSLLGPDRDPDRPLGWRRGAALSAALALGVFAAALPQGSITDEATAAAAVAVWWAVLAAALGRMLPGPPLPRPAIVATGALLLLTALTALSLGWASNPEVAFTETIRLALYAGVLLLLLTGTRAGDGPALLRGLAVGLGAVVLLALGARLLPSLLTGDATRLAAFPDADGRLGYPIAYWNGLGVVAAMAIVLVSWLGSAAAGPRGRALAVAAMPAPFLVLYLTGSRGAMLALGIGLVVLLALAPRRPRLLAGLLTGLAGGLVLIALASQAGSLVQGLGNSEAKSAGLALVGATILVSALAGYVRLRLDPRVAPLRLTPRVGRLSAAAAVALAIVVVLASDPGNRIEVASSPRVSAQAGESVTGRLLAPEGGGRLQLWDAAIDAFVENPLGGVGAGGFSTWWNQNGSLPDPTRHAHSLFLEAFAELGLLGGLLTLALIGAALHGAWTRTFGDLDGTVAAASGLLVVGAFSAAIDWTAAIPAVFIPTLVTIAVLTGPATARSRSRAAAPRAGLRRIQTPALTRAALAAVATAVIVGGALLWLSEQALDRSRELTAAERHAEAAEAAGEAAALLPFAASPRVQLAQVRMLAIDLEGARESILEAIERAPEDPVNYFLLSTIDFFRDDRAWREEILTAFELSPFEAPENPYEWLPTINLTNLP